MMHRDDMINSTYNKNSKWVRQAFHHQLIVLKVVIAYVQHLILVDIRSDKDWKNVANYDVRAREMQHACSQPNA